MHKCFRCSYGHQWELTLREGAPADLRAIACPVCGATAETLTDSVPGADTAVQDSAGTPQAPVQIPGYEIYEELGRGGMGVVFRARQLGLDRMVALKMIRDGVLASVEDRRRFQVEAHAVARMQHPNIVQIHEVAEHQGRHFFSLEYLAGGSLAQELRGVPQPSRAAAEMVETLARAVHAAHEQHTLHRDLKPGNILLTPEGTPKIADFGLAKRLDAATGLTSSGALMGTPSYMAPEQALGKISEVGPAADIYALGAILYEMLAGHPPFLGETPLDTLQQVITDEPVPPRRLQPKVAVDLEVICLKCLHKDPRRRYVAAQDLADDLRQFLAGEPIRARPTGRAELAWRWCRRKPALATTAGVAAAALLSGIGLAVALAVTQTRAARALEEKQQQTAAALERALDAAEKERQARAIADKRLAQLDKANQILASIFGDLEPRSEEREGKPLRAILGERLEKAATQLNEEAVGDPLVVARLQDTLGNSLRALSFPDKAVALHTKARTTHEKLLGPDAPETYTSTDLLAVALQEAGQLKTALPLLVEILDKRRRQIGADDIKTIESINNLAAAYLADEQFPKALALFEELLQKVKAKYGPDDSQTLDAMNNLAVAYQLDGQYGKAVPVLEQVLENVKAKFGLKSLSTLSSMNNLASAYHDAKQLDKALPLYVQALAGRRELLGPEHTDVLLCLNNLGMAYVDSGDPARAVPLLEEALEKRKKKLGADHPDTLVSTKNLAQALTKAGELARAEPLLGDLLVKAKQAYGADDPRTAARMGQLAQNLLQQKKFGEAEPLWRDCLRVCQKTEPAAWTTFNTQSLLGAALAGQRKFTDAEPLLLAGYHGLAERLKKTPKQVQPALLAVAQRLVDLYEAWGNSAAAARWRKELQSLRGGK